MTLYILRHGSRDFGFGDVALSQKGLDEAEQIANEPKFQSLTHIFCSPKLRAKQTIQPLSQHLNLKPIIVPELTQRSEYESESDFMLRCQLSFQKAAQQVLEGQTAVLCSHSDWLQALTWQLLDIPNNPENVEHSLFACAQFRGLKMGTTSWEII